ncbi:MAG: sigma-54-dependent Fis family transcriptional regulator [Bdellovibrionales bacterium]|nr:sigma-54-dependent Fis family transcriptional regulator [Bdellovibrionales bacterium]
MSSETSREFILIVDDEANVRESLKLILGRVYDAQAAESAEEALEMLTAAREAGRLPDLMLLDVTMPGVDGMEMLKKVRKDYREIPVIMLTANKTVKTAVEAMKVGAVDYLNKPYDVDELLSLIEETLKSGATGKTAPSEVVVQHYARPELPDAEGDFGCMVGAHPVMQELYKKIEQVAKRDTTVLVTGESGTGKELIAREIHRRSPRKDGPFVALNCAAIPETLIESELFGHEKGAFTHAVEKRIGHFELADGGTLLLDEIGELSLAVQVKMLRFLQEQEFYRVGRSTPTKVDVRIIAATNKSLEKAVADGIFRQDLFYRINVVTLHTPPLRERSEDIETLVKFFTERLSPIYGGRNPIIGDEVYDLLKRYSWPGNVRELENVTESLLALSSADEITASDLPARLKSSSPSTGNLKQDVLDGIIPFEEAEAEFERDIIVKALVRTGYIQTKAAELLGISRRILKYKMDKLGIADKPSEKAATSES